MGGLWHCYTHITNTDITDQLIGYFLGPLHPYFTRSGPCTSLEDFGFPWLWCRGHWTEGQGEIQRCSFLCEFMCRNPLLKMDKYMMSSNSLPLCWYFCWDLTFRSFAGFQSVGMYIAIFFLAPTNTKRRYLLYM